MPDEKTLCSHSEMIGVADIRKLKELERALDIQLSKAEFLKILCVYNETINRLLKENGEEI